MSDNGNGGSNAEIVSLLMRVLDQQAASDRMLAEHMREEAEVLKGVINAFPVKPDGVPDYDGHREYHDAVIAAARERAQFFRELRMDVARKSFWGLLAVLGALALYWWNNEVKK